MMIFLYICVTFLVWIVIGVFVYQVRLSRHQGMSRDAFVKEFLQEAFLRKYRVVVHPRRTGHGS